MINHRCTAVLLRWREGGREGEMERGREGERERGREGEKALLLPVPKLRCNVNTALNNKGALMITIPGNLHPQLPSSQG
jgi:hypothetical protein